MTWVHVSIIWVVPPMVCYQQSERRTDRLLEATRNGRHESKALEKKKIERKSSLVATFAVFVMLSVSLDRLPALTRIHEHIESTNGPTPDPTGKVFRTKFISARGRSTRLPNGLTDEPLWQRQWEAGNDGRRGTTNPKPFIQLLRGFLAGRKECDIVGRRRRQRDRQGSRTCWGHCILMLRIDGNGGNTAGTGGYETQRARPELAKRTASRRR